MNANRQNGLTLIEVTACIAVLGLLGAVGTGIQNHMSEEVRTAKCQSNLKRQITAIHMYAADYGNMLPGPVHPSIQRGPHNGEGTDSKKTLSWLLRLYLASDPDSNTNSLRPNPVTDEVFRCPTANMISPDREFLGTQTGACWSERPYNYVCNSWGPNGPPGTIFTPASSEWQSTDPPNYFGAWFYCDSDPESPDLCWKPKSLDSIANAAGEWTTADAWHRRVRADSGSLRGPVRRAWHGTFKPNNVALFQPRIPSAPYHRVPIHVARSHASTDSPVLPEIEYTGETNMAYFDGHVAPFKGDWDEPGEGGTVNPYWSVWGGTHEFSEPWDPAGCNAAAP